MADGNALPGQTMTHGTLTVRQFPCLKDNYGFLVRDEATGFTAAVDTPEAAEISRQIEAFGGKLDLIFNTHWHPDHTGGNIALRDRYGCAVIGPAGEADRIPGYTRLVSGGGTVTLGDEQADVLDVGGHTAGHIAYHFVSAGVCFVGDALFSLGCGRLFEGTPAQMWASLTRLRALPGETTIYCAHEYTAANAAFAMTIDPENEGLKTRRSEVERLRTNGEPTVPVRLADELPVNPFLRADDQALAANVGLSGAGPEEVFAEIRRRKDTF